MASLVKQVVPVAWEAFEDYILNSAHFSSSEVEIIKEVLSSSSLNIEELAKEKGLKGRELQEFISKINKSHE
jgi:hypothetical protein